MAYQLKFGREEASDKALSPDSSVLLLYPTQPDFDRLF